MKQILYSFLCTREQNVEWTFAVYRRNKLVQKFSNFSPQKCVVLTGWQRRTIGAARQTDWYRIVGLRMREAILSRRLHARDSSPTLDHRENRSVSVFLFILVASTKRYWTSYELENSSCKQFASPPCLPACLPACLPPSLFAKSVERVSRAREPAALTFSRRNLISTHWNITVDFLFSIFNHTTSWDYSIG